MEDTLEGVAKAGGVAEAMPLRNLLQEEFAVFQIGRAMAELGAEGEMAVAFSESARSRTRTCPDA